MIGGTGLGRGYLNRPDLTADRFQPHPFSTIPGARLYRSGDLARFNLNGEIEYLGRLDQQVKVRGFRIELGEIEAALSTHKSVRECVVTANEFAPGDMRLVAYVVPANDASTPEELRQHLKERLPEYMTPSFFVILEKLPRLPNGKIDRRSLPAPSQPESSREFVAPRDNVETEVANIWSAVLRVARPGVHDNFFELGGHSLLATQIVARINQSFGIDLPLRDMFEAPTIAGLAKAIARNTTARPQQAIERASHFKHVPLSFAQQRLWFLDQLEPGNTAYNMPILLHVEGELDFDVLERCVAEIVQRHDILRTTITPVGGNPVQVITAAGDWRLPVIDLSGLPGDYSFAAAMREARDEAQRPFDLTRGPLLRATAWRLKGNKHLLLIAMHHVISDGWSVGVFSAELSSLYNAFKAGEPSPLRELPVQYADFANWQREHLASEAAEQLTYWKRQLSGRLPVLALPSEQSRLPVPANRVATESRTLPPALIKALKDFSGRNGATPFMTLLTAFQILLHRYTGLDDVVVGTPVAGRTRVQLESLIGMFSNTLVLRGDLSGNPTFVELLGRVREMTLAAHAHQDVPFEMLVEELQPERDLTHTPLFQVMIVLDTPLSAIDLQGLQVRQIELTPAAPKFDLILFLRQRGDELVASWEYSTARHDGESVRRLAESFVTLLQSAMVDPEQRIADLELLTRAERRKLLVEWNDTDANCDQELCLHELFEAQVTRTPEAIALIAGTERITYSELNERANRVARELRALGVGPESLVGVLMQRSSRLIVSLLGVLKAGAAYVPLDPTYPRERLRLMIEDANLQVILTTDDTDQSHGSNPDFIRSFDRCHPRSLAYVIYTSGSTGKPKGTAIEHRSAVTFMHWARDFFTETELSGVLASTSVCFDLSVFEIFVPLTTGGKIILAANALELPTLNAANEVTLINTVPSAMTELIRMRGVPSSVKTVNLAGEPLQKALAQRVYELPNVERLLNLYGPSEDTTYSTWAWIDKDDKQPPTIGRPIANTQAYVLDAQLRPVPVGVTGELYLSGDGLARGYLNKPALTAEKFVPDPFSSAPGARMYRTGDLARYLSDARIEFLGRMDHQVKLRGFRIELGEIETLLGRHPAVQSAVVIARDHGEDKSLAAYFVPAAGHTITPHDLRDFLLERLPKYMAPAFLIELAELPLTPNGKIDRKALPAPEDLDVDREDAVVLPRTHVETAVASLWSQLLNRGDISIHDDFFALGGHSLLAAQLVSRLREQFQVDLPLRSVFETPNVAALAKLIQNSAAESSPIVPIARSESLPVSFAQQRLWLLDQIAASAYNITGGMRLRGELDRSAFTRALNAITDRHEILRTNFALVDGRPLPVIAPKQPADVTFSDLSSLTDVERDEKVRESAEAQLRQSFDLTHGPLLRVMLLRLGNDEHLALVTMHHLVADGWSLNIFVKEFAAFYESFRSGASPDLPELRVQYADYAHWQRERLRAEVLENQLDYWRRTLSGTLPVLQLPTEITNGTEPTLQAIKLIQKIPAELSESLRDLSRSRGVTLFMTLLAAFKTLLHRYTNEEDLLVGTAIAGRNRAEVEDLIGIFINMLVLRTNLSGNPTFLELLGRVREATLDAYANQEVPFEKLVEELQPDRAATRSPFFQVAFGLQQQPLQTHKLDGLELTPLEFDSDVARYDLTLWVFDGEPELKASWTFSTDLYKRETIERMHARFETLLSSIVKNPEARLAALEMFSVDEKQQAAMREQENIDKLLSVRRRSIRTAGA